MKKIIAELNLSYLLAESIYRMLKLFDNKI